MPDQPKISISCYNVYQRLTWRFTSRFMKTLHCSHRLRRVVRAPRLRQNCLMTQLSIIDNVARANEAKYDCCDVAEKTMPDDNVVLGGHGPPQKALKDHGAWKKVTLLHSYVVRQALTQHYKFVWELSLYHPMKTKALIPPIPIVDYYIWRKLSRVCNEDLSMQFGSKPNYRSERVAVCTKLGLIIRKYMSLSIFRSTVKNRQGCERRLRTLSSTSVLWWRAHTIFYLKNNEILKMFLRQGF